MVPLINFAANFGCVSTTSSLSPAQKYIYIQFLEGLFALEFHFQDENVLAVLEWLPGSRYIHIPSTQCDGVQYAYETDSD